MTKIVAILLLAIVATACAVQSSPNPMPDAAPGASSEQTPQAPGNRNQQNNRGQQNPNPPQGNRTPGGRGQQNQNVNQTPAANTQPQNQRGQPQPQPPQNNRGSDATQSLALDVPPHPVDVVLGRPTQKSITASVLMYQDGEGYIEYGTQPRTHPNRTAAQALRQDLPAEILLDGLETDTQYYYQMYYRTGNTGAFAPLAEKSFHTARVSGSTFTFDIQADSHLDSNSNLAVYARTLGNETADKPDFLVDLGDTFMTDKYSPFISAQKQYLAQRYFFGILAPSPLFLVIGNHDGEEESRGGSANNMQTWSAKLRTTYYPNPVPNDFYSGNGTPDKSVGLLGDYYSWEWGGALFIVLDPFWFTPPQRNGDNWNWTLGAEQYQWLKKTLETSRAKYKFVFIHHLVGGVNNEARGGIEAAKFYEWGGNNADGSGGFAPMRPGWAMPIHPLLVQNKVSVVFHGHDHLFVKQELDGVVYQEVPQPSTARFLGSPASVRQNAYAMGYTQGDMLSSPGHLRVTVTDTNVTVEYVRAYLPQDENAQRKNGQVDYTYTLVAK